jgi:hypothetical protein
VYAPALSRKGEMDFTECAHSISPAKNKHSAATHRSAAAKQARTFCAAHVYSLITFSFVVSMEVIVLFFAQMNESCRLITYAGA